MYVGHWLLGFFDPGKIETEKGVPWAHPAEGRLLDSQWYNRHRPVILRKAAYGSPTNDSDILTSLSFFLAALILSLPWWTKHFHSLAERRRHQGRKRFASS